MNFLTPSWLILLLLALPILVLYMLKLRRKDVQVSSTFLWETLLRDRQANTPWQRLRRNLLLILQLLILALMVFGQARPYVRVAGAASESVIVILDGSASMSATDVSPNRFEYARSGVSDQINSLPEDSRMTLILAANPPQVLASSESDHQALENALESATLSHGTADWQTSFVLAAGASTTSADPADILIYSDGGLPNKGLPSLPGVVRYIPIGISPENLAVSAMAVRNSGSSAELFASVTNYGKVPHTCILSFYHENVLLTSQRVELLPGATESVSWQGLPQNHAVFRAHITPEGEDTEVLDWLGLDDTAFAIGQPVNSGRVLIVSAGNFFLEQVFASIPGISAYRALDQSAIDGSGESHFRLPEDKFDLYVLDGVLPSSQDSGIPALPDGNLLLINPPSNPLFHVTGTFTNTLLIHQEKDGIMQYVDWSEVQVSRAHHVQTPAWGKLQVESEGGPLLFAGETDGRRVAALTFDLHESDLPLKIAFPILFTNLIGYLAPPQPFDTFEGLQPGEALNILPPPGVEQILIVTPSEKTIGMLPGAGSLTFTQTDELGVYAVNYLYEENEDFDLFAVNLFDAGESNIQPAEKIFIGQAIVNPTIEEKLGRREIWRQAALLAVLVLIIEWWVYHRHHRLDLQNWFKSVLKHVRRHRRVTP